MANWLKAKLSYLWETMRATQSSRKHRFVSSVAISVLSLAFLIVALYTQWDAFCNHLRAANGWLIALTLIGYPIGLLPVALAWHEIMAGLGACRDLRTNLHNYALSALPKRIPGAIWYVASRVVLYDACGTSPVLTVSATVLETLMLILTGLALFAIPVLANEVILGASLGRVVAGLVLPILIVFLFAWRPLAQRVLVLLKVSPDGFDLRPMGPVKMARVVVICIAGWLGGGVLLFFMSRAFVAVPYHKLPTFVGIWGGAGAVSLVAGYLVQGLGLREITLAVLLAGYMPFSVAVAVALLFRLLLSVGEFVWAVVLARLSAVPGDHPKGLLKQ